MLKSSKPFDFMDEANAIISNDQFYDIGYLTDLK
mgnify:CR=1 FL=1